MLTIEMRRNKQSVLRPTRAGIGAAVNGTFQAMDDEPFSLTELTAAAATSALTTGAGILPSLYINSSGALLSAQITGKPQFPNMAGAGGGSLAGSGVSTTLDFISTSNTFGKYSTLVNKALKNVNPVASSIAQERVDNLIKNKLPK